MAEERSELSQLSVSLAPLAAELRRFDPVATATRVAALLTEPRLQANAIRFEVLLHLALIHCDGRAKVVSPDVV